jgi:hypothetical protein
MFSGQTALIFYTIFLCGNFYQYKLINEKDMAIINLHLAPINICLSL